MTKALLDTIDLLNRIRDYLNDHVDELIRRKDSEVNGQWSRVGPGQWSRLWVDVDELIRRKDSE
jgi:hypothetical protein